MGHRLIWVSMGSSLLPSPFGAYVPSHFWTYALNDRSQPSLSPPLFQRAPETICLEKEGDHRAYSLPLAGSISGSIT